MSARPVFYVHCDVEDCYWHHDNPSTISAADARRWAKRAGWTRRRVNFRNHHKIMDLCPTHVDYKPGPAHGGY